MPRGRLAVEPYELLELRLGGERQIVEAEHAAGRRERGLELDRRTQFGADQRGIQLPDFAREDRVHLEHDQQRSCQALAHLESTHGALAHAGQPSEPLLRETEKFAQPSLTPPEVSHPRTPLGCPSPDIPLDGPRRRCLFTLGASRGCASAHRDPYLHWPNACRAAAAMPRASPACRSMPSCRLRAGVRWKT